MAKALVGQFGAPDPRLLAEVRRLRLRVRDLECELDRAQHERDVLAAADAVVDLAPTQLREPALA